MNIELEATNAIRTLISRNAYLSPYIDENDKTPAWDGFVYVYGNKNPNHPKESLIGRVPIQVKGKRVEEIKEEYISYKIERNDLNAYRSEGGSIFFVVQITEKYDVQVYFKELLPLDIERLLKKMGNHKSKKVRFKKIPLDEDGLANLFLNFIHNRKKQVGTVDKEKLYFDDWDNSLESIENFYFSCSLVNIKPENVFKALTTMPIYLYAKPKGLNIKIPIDRFTSGVITENTTHEIGIEDKIYYDKAKVVWENGQKYIKFGTALSIAIQEDRNNGINIKLNIKPLGALNERIEDGNFFSDVNKAKGFTINGIKIPLNDEIDDEIKRLLLNLDTLRELKCVLHSLNVNEDLELDSLSNEEGWKIDFLLNINKVTNYEFKSDGNPLKFIKIGNIKILFIEENVNGNILASDYFSENSWSRYKIFADNKLGEKQEISKYLLLKANDLTCSNCVCKNIFEDIIKYDTGYEYQISVNYFLLEIIKAYDMNIGKHEDLYKLAVQVSEWLCNKSENDVNYRMNYLQIKKRKQPLNDAEISELENIIKSYFDDWSIKVGALILLGKINEAEKIIREQSKENKSKFKQYPIYSLINR